MSLAGRERGRRGVVLLVVLFFALLLTSSVATFLRRSTVDTLIARNIDARGEADVLARGGLLLSWALLAEDRLQELAGTGPVGDNYLDAWARVSAQPPLMTAKGSTLRLKIEDAGARLNLNALFEMDQDGVWKVREETPEFLVQVLAKVIDELPLPRARRAQESRELAENLIDFVDGDDVSPNGSPEDEPYQRRNPPTGPVNRPLLSFEELRLVAGFDDDLVEALRPYLTVYPFAALGCGNPSQGCGVNLNTAPPHVLALLWFDDGVEKRLADEDTVRQILRVRSEGGLLCGEGSSQEGCTPIREIVPNAIFPPPTFSTQIFEISAEARVGDVRSSLVAVVDRTSPALPALLSWQIR
jgi:type II secretory pathway component PulK